MRGMWQPWGTAGLKGSEGGGGWRPQLGILAEVTPASSTAAWPSTMPRLAGPPYTIEADQLLLAVGVDIAVVDSGSHRPLDVVISPPMLQSQKVALSKLLATTIDAPDYLTPTSTTTAVSPAWTSKRGHVGRAIFASTPAASLSVGSTQHSTGPASERTAPAAPSGSTSLPIPPMSSALSTSPLALPSPAPAPPPRPGSSHHRRQRQLGQASRGWKLATGEKRGRGFFFFIKSGLSDGLD